MPRGRPTAPLSIRVDIEDYNTYSYELKRRDQEDIREKMRAVFKELVRQKRSQSQESQNPQQSVETIRVEFIPKPLTENERLLYEKKISDLMDKHVKTLSELNACKEKELALSTKIKELESEIERLRSQSKEDKTAELKRHLERVESMKVDLAVVLSILYYCIYENKSCNLEETRGLILQLIKNAKLTPMLIEKSTIGTAILQKALRRLNIPLNYAISEISKIIER